jgi:hypothetical protein
MADCEVAASVARSSWIRRVAKRRRRTGFIGRHIRSNMTAIADRPQPRLIGKGECVGRRNDRERADAMRVRKHALRTRWLGVFRKSPMKRATFR